MFLCSDQFNSSVRTRDSVSILALVKQAGYFVPSHVVSFGFSRKSPMLAFRRTWLLRESSVALFRVPRVAEETFDGFVSAV